MMKKNCPFVLLLISWLISPHGLVNSAKKCRLNVQLIFKKLLAISTELHMQQKMEIKESSSHSWFSTNLYNAAAKLCFSITVKPSVLTILLSLVLFSNDLSAQCTISQSTFSGGANMQLGQSFTATCDGTLKNIKVLIYSDRVVSLTVYKGDGLGGSNLGTMSGVNLRVNYPNTSAIDLSSLNIPLTSGDKYTFYFSSGFTLGHGGGEVYAGGKMYQNGSANSSNDLVFDVEMIPDDADPPVVQSMSLSGSPATDATSVTYSVSFDESANDITTDDFEVTTVSGNATGSVSTVSASSGTSLDVTVNSILGTGTLRLDLKSSTNITDDSGNGNGSNGYVTTYTSGDTHAADVKTTPGVTTAVSAVVSIAATLGGEVTSDGNAGVTEKGVVYSTTDATPEIGEAGVTQDGNGSGTGTFSESISSLSANTTYYVRAYAVNSEGTSYGNVESFTTTSSTGSIIITSDASSPSEEWSLDGGILKPLVDGAKVNLSEVQTALASGALQIQTPVDVIIDTDIDFSLSAEQTLTLKADGNVIMNPGASISATSSALNMIFWSDADGDEDGVVWLNWNLSDGGTTVDTNGGDLWIGGGSGAVTWNGLSVGDGVARGNSSNANGITLIQSILQTHGGNMAFYGRGGTNITSTIDMPGTGSTTTTGNNNDGIRMFGGNNIDADGGKIYMYGYADDPTGNGNGVELSQESSGGGDLISSSNSADDAIVIEGYAEGNSSAGNSWGFYTHYSTIQNIGGGGIHIKGSGAKNSGVTVATNGAVLANSGKIILEGIGAGSGQPAVLIQGAVGQKAGTDITTSSTDIEIIGNELSISGSDPNGMVSSSGILTVRPYTAGLDIGIGSGSGTLQLPASYFSTNFVDGFSDIIVGDENAGLITIDGATIYNDSLTLKTDATIVFNATADISSAVANALTLWSRASGTNDASDSNYGAIWMLQGSSINTAGGNLTMGGGEDPLIGYAMGDASAPNGEGNARFRGVAMNGSIDAAGGNIIINGKGASNIGNTRGTSLGGPVKTEGTGNITVRGIGRGSSDAIALGDSFFTPVAVGTLEAETGNINLYSEPSSSTYKGLNLSTTGSNISTGGDFSVTSSGRIVATSGSFDIGGTTYLEAGTDIDLSNESNDFAGNITVNGATDLQIIDLNVLNLGEVSVNGTIDIATLSGDLMISENIATTDGTSEAIKIFADKNKNAGDASGGNIKISGTPTISTGIGGQARLYSGSGTGSTDLITLVGKDNTRYNVDVNTTVFDPVLNAGNYALIRGLEPTVIQFNSASSSGIESVSTAILQVDLSFTVSENVTVDYTVSGTATGNGTDYTLADGTLTIPMGNTSGSITIADIVDDAVLETSEAVIVTLSNPSNNAVLVSNKEHTYKIIDDDNASVSIADVSGNEDDGAITVTATLDNAVQGGFTVDVSTSDGTATAGTDYTAVSSETLTFVGIAGETQIFTVTPTADSKVESNVTLSVSMSSLAATTLSLGITDDAIITITDDDHLPIITVDQTFSIAENANNGTSVGNVLATDADELTSFLDWAIISGNDEGIFALNLSSGGLTVNDNTQLDYEGTTSYTLTLTVSDGANTSASETVTINVGEINNTPTFTKGADQSVIQDAGLQTVTGWASAISSGSEDESDQILTFHVSNDNEALFSVQPAIDTNGTLTFTSAESASGIAIVMVSLSDDGGTDNGGVDTSDKVTFIINIVSKLSQEISMEEIPDQKIGQNPIVLSATGGDSGNPVIYSLVTEPASGVAYLEDNLLFMEGVGKVTVIASQAGNDTYRAAEDVSVSFPIKQNELFLPTLFSPNGDQSNDFFILRGAGGVSSIEMTIYDREGVQIYQSTDFESITQKGWDGTYQGNELIPGNYVWVLKGSYANGEPLQVNGKSTGTVRLVR